MNVQELYKNLMSLADDAEGKFFFADHLSPLGEKFRVFSYHIASYSDWLLPGALEARGIMFQLDDNDEMIRIVSRPMEKFFNLNENPFTMELDLTTTVQLMDKADGSLISTYLSGENFALKSKTSIFSEQAVAANRYIKKPENRDLWEFCDDCTQAGLTVNMEWCAPNNRIVLEYPEAKLVILNIRDNETGDYVSFDDIPQSALMRVKQWLVDEYDPATAHEPDFVEKLRDTKGIEGMILRLANGQSVKIKTQWYVDLHSQKDSVNVPKKLVTTILNGNHDDLYALFADDKPTIERIREFDSHVTKTLTNSFNAVRQFYARNRHLARKDYAIAGQKVLKPWEFGVAMIAYQKQTVEGVYESLVTAYLKRPELAIPEKYLNGV
ncbi:RNA ligase A [Vibrio phage phi-ST2]|uniref:RNA ligase 1 n=1 Tax=Vibrio phage VH7D TaxID=1262539 RepID=V9LZ19_9CAUD|nr:RNA ligase and tail fiber protein attachment catalyst [Vibrio phage VH7D]ALP47377.1 RNA ligase A [Vibrio phage phi-ST2]QBX06003.1 RNA ligase [Vibrio phage Va3]QNJ54627.1 RNA ligase [Vibrio phage vB_ValM_R10Z]URQ03670.1 RNA ligase [Vibrio phage PVA23]AGB07092.1 RNA ligase [Vibrio phage VH7D]